MSYLLIYGEHQLGNNWKSSARRCAATMLHEDMRSFYNGFPATPIRWRSWVRSWALSTHRDSLDVHSPEKVQMSVYRLMAKIPTIAAYSHKKSIGRRSFIQVMTRYCENFCR